MVTGTAADTALGQRQIRIPNTSGSRRYWQSQYLIMETRAGPGSVRCFGLHLSRGGLTVLTMPSFFCLAVPSISLPGTRTILSGNCGGSDRP